MNYAQARQRESDKRWDWTVRNDDAIWQHTCCAEHGAGHAEREDAERCFYAWELAQPVRIFDEPDARRQCALCGMWTNARVRLANGYTSFVLCESHQDRTSVYPFIPNTALTYS